MGLRRASDGEVYFPTFAEHSGPPQNEPDLRWNITYPYILELIAGSRRVPLAVPPGVARLFFVAPAYGHTGGTASGTVYMATDKPICAKCGKTHLTWQGKPACSGHQSGDPTQPCAKNPLRGMRVCRTHGGALPAAVKARDERLALMEANGEIAQLVRECDIPEQHPIDGLLEVVRVSGSMMRLLTIKVGELSEDAEVREVLVESKKGDLYTKRVAGDDAFWGLDKDSQMVPHIYVKLLRIWTERYERACKTALEAGIEERRIRLAEDTADTFFTALSKAIAVAGLDPTMQAALNQAMAKELRVSVIELI